jgi:hypothetical protein
LSVLNPSLMVTRPFQTLFPVFDTFAFSLSLSLSTFNFLQFQLPSALLLATAAAAAPSSATRDAVIHRSRRLPSESTLLQGPPLTHSRSQHHPGLSRSSHRRNYVPILDASLPWAAPWDQTMRQRSRTGSRASSLATPSVEQQQQNPLQQPSAQGASGATTGLCRRCTNVVGEFFNQFHKVSGTYYLPALLGSYKSKLQPTSSRPKPATPGTELDGW